MKELLLTTLHFAVSFVPGSFKSFAVTLLEAFQRSGWLEDDERWSEAAAVVTKWLKDVQVAYALRDRKLTNAARLAAEVAATRELSRLGLLKAV